MIERDPVGVSYGSCFLRWPDSSKEHCTQYYPNWCLLQFPKKYLVRNVKDEDFCRKSFNEKNDFAYGVFSVGIIELSSSLSLSLSPFLSLSLRERKI